MDEKRVLVGDNPRNERIFSTPLDYFPRIFSQKRSRAQTPSPDISSGAAMIAQGFARVRVLVCCNSRIFGLREGPPGMPHSRRPACGGVDCGQIAWCGYSGATNSKPCLQNPASMRNRTSPATTPEKRRWPTDNSIAILPLPLTNSYRRPDR